MQPDIDGIPEAIGTVPGPVPADRLYNLDACPALVERTQYEHLQRLMVHHHHHPLFQRIVLLIRDPVDRIMSSYNNLRPHRFVKDIDHKVSVRRGSFNDALSNAVTLLETAVFCLRFRSHSRGHYNELIKTISTGLDE